MTMTPRRQRAHRCAIALGVALLAMVGPSAALSVDELMTELRAVPERHGSFEETKRMAVLTQPLVRRGTLEYVRPDRLTMRVDTPYFERLHIRGDEVSIERRSGTTRVALSSQPALAVWIESMRATLAGDAGALDRHFRARVEGSLAQWRLDLVPKDPQLAARVTRVVVEGQGAQPLRFEIEESRGDSTMVVVTPRPQR
jgi:hypothetical protein